MIDMVWPFKTRSAHGPSEDAKASAYQAGRALTDARNLDGRANAVADALAAQRRENHIAAAVRASILGKASPQ